MLRPLLLFTLICTCGPAQICAQFKLSVDAGHAHAIFNERQTTVMAPPFIASNVPTNQRAEIQAVAGIFLALGLEYSPPENLFAWELRLQYMSRGYDFLIFDQPFGGVSFPFVTSRGHYLDVMPAIIYHFSPQFSLRAGPYLSLLLASEDRYFLSSDTHRINQMDAGLDFGASLSSGRFHLRLDYQRSLSNLAYPIYDINLFTSEFYDDFPVSTLRVGLGYTLLRPDRGLVPVPHKNQFKSH